MRSSRPMPPTWPPGSLACSPTTTCGTAWPTAGADHVAQRHRLDVVERRFAEVIEASWSSLQGRGERLGDDKRPPGPDPSERAAVQRRLRAIGRPGSVLLVATRSEA